MSTDQKKRLRVFIENEAGSSVKHLYDEKMLALKGTTRVSRAFLWPYGFVLNTTGEDGDNVYCYVLTKRTLRTGVIVECEPVGLMEQIEDGEIDHKVLAVLSGETVQITNEIARGLADFAMHVFEHIPGKQMRVGRFLDRQAAFDYVASHADDARS